MTPQGVTGESYFPHDRKAMKYEWMLVNQQRPHITFRKGWWRVDPLPHIKYLARWNKAHLFVNAMNAVDRVDARMRGYRDGKPRRANGRNFIGA